MAIHPWTYSSAASVRPGYAINILSKNSKVFLKTKKEPFGLSRANFCIMKHQLRFWELNCRQEIEASSAEY